MQKLDDKIKDYLDLVVPAAKKELEFVEANDWSIEKKEVRRKKIYNLQKKFNDRNSVALTQLYSMAGDNLKHPKIKAAIALLGKFYTHLEARYHVMDAAFEWTSIDIDKDTDQKIEKELDFQSSVREDLLNIKKKLREINFGEESDEIKIPVFKDQAIPLIMSKAIEKRYPQIREKLKKE